MPLSLLLVEDDAVLADGLLRTLQAQDMRVELVGDGLAADVRLQAGQPGAQFSTQYQAQFQVIVLDIGLPGIDGFEVVRRLRARGATTPVLLLTARDAVEDRVRGLETGADDYLVKPFATAELVARIRALARRVAPPGQPDPGQLGLGKLSLDSTTRRARVGERVLDLAAREWGVLEYLLQNSGRVVSKQQIIDAIAPWGDDLTLNAVEVYVSRLRLKLEGAGVAIRTIRGFGYLLEAEQ
ncbi:MAG: response regulator transcription factor [Lysobacteraceae bacterium]|nr:MAG: response regulator transcription factor [Xanthomonadaceae bacterium]